MVEIGHVAVSRAACRTVGGGGVGRLAMTMVLAAFCIGCGEHQLSEAGARDAVPIRQMVAGSAEQALDANGQFMMNLTAPHGGRAQIDQTQAIALAQAFLRDFAPGILPHLEQTYGGKINLRGLRECGRVLYATSPYAEMADDALPVVQRTFGSYWLVTLCSGFEPVVSLAVSVYNTHLSIQKGHLSYPSDQIGGQEFWATGIPRRHGMLPLSPEEAVRMVYSLTGRRVIDTPILVMPSTDAGIPQRARWKLRLDQPMSFRVAGGHQRITTDQVFASIQLADEPPRVEIATAEQPAPRSLRVPSMASVRSWQQKSSQQQRTGMPLADVTIAQRRTDPTMFVPVSPLRGDNP